jgi:uncharacterized membrane protein
MVLMAALVWFRPAVTGIIGCAIIAGQQLFSLAPLGPAWEFVYPSGQEAWPGITILYVLVPWIGVMAAGYGFGVILLKEPRIRRSICLGIGFAAIVIFVAVGSLLASGDTSPFLSRLLNQQKYPPSILYLLMTLGPAIALVPFADRARGWLANIMITFGKVPMFYYLMHIWIIHISALIVQWLQTGIVHHEWYATAPYATVPPEHRWSLPLLYLVFFVDVTLLYMICRWYVQYKFSHPEKKWLKYL